jgi:hypothetical protein
MVTLEEISTLLDKKFDDRDNKLDKKLDDRDNKLDKKLDDRDNKLDKKLDDKLAPVISELGRVSSELGRVSQTVDRLSQTVGALVEANMRHEARKMFGESFAKHFVIRSLHDAVPSPHQGQV